MNNSLCCDYIARLGEEYSTLLFGAISMFEEELANRFDGDISRMMGHYDGESPIIALSALGVVLPKEICIALLDNNCPQFSDMGCQTILMGAEQLREQLKEKESRRPF